MKSKFFLNNIVIYLLIFQFFITFFQKETLLVWVLFIYVLYTQLPITTEINNVLFVYNMLHVCNLRQLIR